MPFHVEYGGRGNPCLITAAFPWLFDTRPKKTGGVFVWYNVVVKTARVLRSKTLYYPAWKVEFKQHTIYNRNKDEGIMLM